MAPPRLDAAPPEQGIHFIDRRARVSARFERERLGGAAVNDMAHGADDPSAIGEDDGDTGSEQRLEPVTGIRAYHVPGVQGMYHPGEPM
jgi:hypothetical protein